MSARVSPARARRSGFFKYVREPLDNIWTCHGVVAWEIFVTLISNARIDNGAMVLGLKPVELQRGTALFSVRTFAARLKRSQYQIHRSFKKLQAAGELKVVSLGHRIERTPKRKGGTAPTVVSIVNFESYNFSDVAAKHHFQTHIQTKERMNTEKASVMEEILEDQYDSDEHPADHVAAGVLEAAEKHISAARHPSEAVAAIKGAIANKFSPATLVFAAKTFSERCAEKGGDPRTMAPEHFFGAAKLYARYVDPPLGNGA
jgi:hypothetical protein